MKNKKLVDSVKQNPLTWICGVILVVQFLLVAFCNLTLLDSQIDCDVAKMFAHIREMWNQKQIFLEGWSYITTVEFDCGSLLAFPLYGLTGNILLAYGLANILLTALYLWVIFYLFRGQKWLYPILSSNLILIPYAVGMLDYFNMMFFNGAQYIMKTMLPLMLLGILMAVERAKKEDGKMHLSVETMFFMVVFAALFFLTSLSSGVYVMACGIFPVLAAYVLYHFSTWKKIPGIVYGLGALIVVCFLTGYYANTVIMSGARGNAMVLSPSSYMPTGIMTTIVAMFELFGGLKNTLDLAVLSVDGILTLAKFALVLGFLACGICACRWVLRKKADLRSIVLIAMFLWNLFVLLVTYTRAGSATYEYRYHLIGMIPLVCVSVIVLLHYLEQLNPGQRRLIVTAGVLFLAVLIGGSFYRVFTVGEKNPQLKELCAYVEEQNMDWDYIYMYDASNDSDICRLLDEDNLYLCVTPAGCTWVYDYYEKYVQGPIYSDNAIMVVDEARYQLGDRFELFGHTFVRFEVVAGRSLYYFET